jgi:hypothetical protein
VRAMKRMELLVAGRSVKTVAAEVGYRQPTAFVELAKSAPARCKGRGDRAVSSLGNHLEGPNVNLSVALTLPAVGIDDNLQQTVHLPSPEISVGEELQR